MSCASTMNSIIQSSKPRERFTINPKQNLNQHSAATARPPLANGRFTDCTSSMQQLSWIYKIKIVVFLAGCLADRTCILFWNVVQNSLLILGTIYLFKLYIQWASIGKVRIYLYYISKWKIFRVGAPLER